MVQSMSPSPHSIQSAIPQRRWKVPPQESLHTCRVCRKVCLSSRALNGHLRIHAGRSDASRDASAQVHRNFPLPEVCWCRPHTIHTLPAMKEEVKVDQEEDYVIADADTDAEEHEEEDYHDAKGETHHIQVTSCINNQPHSKRNPLYELRQNPKRSRVMTDVDFWGLQDCPAKQLTSAVPKFKAPAYPCSMCAARSFCSLKALHGHMRSHPDRSSRGVFLPNPAHLEEPLHSDLRRDRRACSLVHLDTKNEDMKALCNGGESPLQRVELGVQSAIGVPTRQQSSSSESALTSASLSIEEEPAEIHKKDTEVELGSLEASAAVCLVMLSKGITDCGLSSLCDLFNGRRNDSDHISSHTKQESIAVARKEGKFQSKTCNTSHALGGHRASHGKLKSSITKEKAYANFNVDSIDLLHEVKGHACSVCHRSFLTGQALGHWTAGDKYPDYEDAIASKFQQ